MERRVERGLRRLLPRDGGEALADLLERERIVAEKLGVLVDESLGRRDGLVVALDRRRLSVARHAFVPHGHVDDVRVVRGLACDDEGLRQLQADDPSVDLHARSLDARRRAVD